MTNADSRPAVVGQVERGARPRAWAWKDEPSGIEVYSGWDEPRPTNGSEPLYDQAAIDAAVNAERARIADAMRNIVRALRLPDEPDGPNAELTGRTRSGSARS